MDSFDEHGNHTRGGVELVTTRSAPDTAAGVLLRRLRQALRLTLDDAGRSLGLSIVEVSEIECGILVVSDREFVRACRLLCGAAKT